MVKKIALFNHKGGVSKTTSTYNIGWMLAEKGYKVIMVDTDPQCNLTELVLGNDFEKYYIDKPFDNIKEALAPAFESRPEPLKAVECIQVEKNDNLFLLPGHVNFSEYEVTLGIAQELSSAIPTLKNLPGAINELFNLTSEKYNADFLIIDMNPSLSSINQNLFTISDYFIIPTAPDYFSILALRSLGKILPKWEFWAKRARLLFQDSIYKLSTETPKFLGAIVQNYSIRKGEPSKAFQKFIDKVSSEIKDSLIPNLKKEGMMLEDDKYDEDIIKGRFQKPHFLKTVSSLET